MSSTAGFYAAKLNNGIFGPASCHTISVPTSPLAAIYPEFSYTATPFPFDVNIQINAVPFDYYSGVGDSLLCYQNVTSVESAANSEQVSVFPNPARDQFVITAENENRIDVSVSNLLGEKIYAKENLPISAGRNYRIDCSLFPAGIYIVQANSTRIKLVIEK